MAATATRTMAAMRVMLVAGRRGVGGAARGAGGVDAAARAVGRRSVATGAGGGRGGGGGGGGGEGEEGDGTGRVQVHYDVLGVARTATLKEIKAAYYRASMQHHPDHNQSRPDAHARFAKINEAYSVLSDDARRQDYDRSLATPHQAAHQSAAGSAGGSPRRATSAGFRPQRRTAGQSMRYNEGEHYSEHYGRDQQASRARRQAAEEHGQAQQHQDGPRVSAFKVGLLVLLLVVAAQGASRRNRNRRQQREHRP